MEILRFDDICLTYHTEKEQTNAIQGLSLTINKGEFVSIVGPSGCGKTTILSLISGLMKPTSGRILIGGNEVTQAAKNVGYMLQRDQLFEWRTIRKNVEIGLEIQGKKTKENLDYVVGLLKKYGLGEFMDYYPNQLSGGMRQRAALIRTLATSPDILLLDEPFSALDYQTRMAVCNDVSSIIRSEGKTAILVSHDIAESLSMSDRVVVLSARPAKLKQDFVLDFTETVPLLRREDENFPKWFDKIWKELEQNEEC